MALIEFDPSRSDEEQAVVVSFDLCGFSDFCNQADAYASLPKFLSALFDEVNESFLGWPAGTDLLAGFDEAKVRSPDFMKYTGDGALLIWLLPGDLQHRQNFCTAVVRAMRKLQQRLGEVIPQWAVEWQVHNLPQRARFGIATGLVHPLCAKSPTLIPGPVEDYAGYCINLAVRLQNHCPEVDFIVHEPVFPRLEGLVKFIAHGMKGARHEPVLIYGTGLCMTVGNFKSKFLPIGDESEHRIKAIRPEKYSSEEQAALSQPRFEARFVGGPMNGVWALLPARPNEWHPITDVKDPTGKLIGKEMSWYRLAEHGPPLIYQFVSKEPCDLKEGNWITADYWTRKSSGT